MARHTLAVAASAAFPDLRPDWPLLRDALEARDVTADTAVWTDPEVDWSGFDLVVANGAWDYLHQPTEFLDWAERVAALTMLVNSPTVLRWNIDKQYLGDLAQAGVATVPTTWLEAEESATLPAVDREIVVKPAISAGGYETARYQPGEAAAAHVHMARLLDAGRTVMVQPYMSSIDAQGEVGLIFLGGTFSHAISKGALLRPGAGTQEELWRDMEIGSTTPSEVQLSVAQSALDASEQLVGPSTYARVDLVPLDDGTPALLELELLDPALFFEVHPPGATRFAEVLSGLLEAPRG